MLGYGVTVKGLVSDRARALIKLGKPEYLGVGSVADLFHYTQDMGKAVGIQAGSLLGRKQKKLEKEGLNEEERGLLGPEIEPLASSYNEYRKEMETINKIVHPFNGADQLQGSEQIGEGLAKNFVRIGHTAKKLDIDISLQRSGKILGQIPDIAAGVQNWRNWLEGSVEELLENVEGEIKDQLRTWVIGRLVPLAYWRVNLPKTQAKAKNRGTWGGQRTWRESSKDLPPGWKGVMGTWPICTTPIEGYLQNGWKF